MLRTSYRVQFVRLVCVRRAQIVTSGLHRHHQLLETVKFAIFYEHLWTKAIENGLANINTCTKEVKKFAIL